MSTFAVFGARPNPTPIGPPFVEAVPRGSHSGPDGALYVSELTGLPFPTGFARIHRVAPDGTTSVYATGLTAIVDLAFSQDGALYALQHSFCGPFFACPAASFASPAPARIRLSTQGSPVRLASRSAPEGAFYVSNRSDTAGIGEVLRIQP